MKFDAPYILTANVEILRSADQTSPFVQEGNFFYTTGLNLVGWVAIVSESQKLLVAPASRDDVAERFDGDNTPTKEEAERLAREGWEIINRDEMEEVLKSLSSKYDTVRTVLDSAEENVFGSLTRPEQAALTRQLKGIFKHVEDAAPSIAKARALKSEKEREVLKKAIGLTADSFAAVKQNINSFTYEYEVEAEFTYAFRKSGAEGHAYEPIVASGENALTLHYIKNTAQLPQNGLVLIDIGAKVNGYAADITRTYAVGTPSDRETAVHAAVEKAHHEIIQQLKPGLAIKAYIELVDDIMKDALVSLGLLSDKSDNETYRNYFPHAISHGLGIDVHESLGGYKEFMPGMVFTVEPGIYIPEEGIGVRIEDDILITDTGYENLSGHLSTSL